MSSCQGFLGSLFGHKFRARYSEGSPTLTSIKGSGAMDIAEFVRSTKPVTYHYDICERCGEIKSAT